MAYFDYNFINFVFFCFGSVGIVSFVRLSFGTRGVHVLSRSAGIDQNGH